MDKYNHKKIEQKWQKYWNKKKLYKTKDLSTSSGRKKWKYYVLDMFPYPSGDGLHAGHTKGYVANDILARMKMMQGYNVLHPMGWDAFGLPAENYALKNKVHPRKAVEKNIKKFKSQLEKIGFTYDWSREINTTDPEFYKITQWMFLQMFKKGLAYESDEPVNWCPGCKTVLADEDLENGKCERCGSKIEKKPLRQWVLRITDYADKLLEGLDGLDWEDSIKEMQRNWIGKSEGAVVKFKVIASGMKQSSSNMSGDINNKIATSPSAPRNDSNIMEVFTTRPDTLFGCTYMVVSPEHELIKKLSKFCHSKLDSESQKNKNKTPDQVRDDTLPIKNLEEVKKYIKKAKSKSDLERTDLAKEKTGVELKGVKAINPVNNEEIPIWVADYVLASYGTGAIMAVPAHDKRDFEFAKKYNLPIRQVVSCNYKSYNNTLKTLKLLDDINKKAKEKDIKIWLLGGLACAFCAKVVYREHSDLDLIVKNKKDLKIVKEILEELNFAKNSKEKANNLINTFTHRNSEGMEIDINYWLKDLKKELTVSENDFEENKKELLDHKSLVLSYKYIKKFKKYQRKKRNKEKDSLDLEFLSGKVITENGIAVNSEKFNNLTTNEFKKKIIEWLEKNKVGKRAVNYKLRDWVFSRQRYWGEPIPIIHCKKCGAVAVPEKYLPVKLPEVKNYKPTGAGESPLANIKDWVNVKCPKCGGTAKRETNTMPQWAGSSWYYLAYVIRDNSKFKIPTSPAGRQNSKLLNHWMPVDFYVGGAEHATRHLIYARFWHKFLYDIKVVGNKEPFKKLQHVGLVLAEDGRKMSKRWGNVINPDDMVEKYGADSLRIYEMFMGPFNQPVAWSTNGLIGTKRFIQKVFKLFEKLQIQNSKSQINPKFLPRRQAGKVQNNKINQLLHQTIKKVTEDIESFDFNTAISQLMILTNAMEKEKTIPIASYQLLVTLLSPFAPHIAEELWHKTQTDTDSTQTNAEKISANYKSVFLQPWPNHDPKFIKEKEIELVIQINGKVRDKIKVLADISENDAKKISLESEKIKKWVKDKKVRKIIFIKGKLVNIVI